jgi:hypothetical protein
MTADLDGFQNRVRLGRWFHRLGSFAGCDGYFAITDHNAWVAHTRRLVLKGFGFHGDDPRDIGQLAVLDSVEWFPTEQSAEDPFHQRTLYDRIQSAGKTELLKRWSLENCRIARSGFATIPENRWLKVGRTDYLGAAEQALLFAIRMAATELLTDQVGIWCACVDLYCAGHWPFGRLPTGEIAVL